MTSTAPTLVGAGAFRLTGCPGTLSGMAWASDGRTWALVASVFFGGCNLLRSQGDACVTNAHCPNAQTCCGGTCRETCPGGWSDGRGYGDTRTGDGGSADPYAGDSRVSDSTPSDSFVGDSLPGDPGPECMSDGECPDDGFCDNGQCAACLLVSTHGGPAPLNCANFDGAAMSTLCGTCFSNHAADSMSCSTREFSGAFCTASSPLVCVCDNLSAEATARCVLSTACIP